MATALTRMNIEGRPYVLLPEDEYDRLMSGLPKLPPRDRRGHRPAAATARVLMARKIIKRRIELGLEQKELAALAGLRAETICKLESGKNTARTETIARLEAAFKKAAGRKGR